MSGWTREELDRIEQTDELDLASQRRDGSLRDPVIRDVGCPRR